MGRVLVGWVSRFCYVGNGRHRHFSVSPILGQYRPGRCEPLVSVERRKQLYHATAWVNGCRESPKRDGGFFRLGCFVRKCLPSRICRYGGHIRKLGQIPYGDTKTSAEPIIKMTTQSAMCCARISKIFGLFSRISAGLSPSME